MRFLRERFDFSIDQHLKHTEFPILQIPTGM